MIGDCILWPEGTWQTGLFRFVSFFGDGVLAPVALVLALALFFYLFKKDTFFAVTVAVAPLVGQLVKFALKNLFQVTRPAETGCRVLTTYGDRFSFPSGHTIFYVIIFGLVAFYYLGQPRNYKSRLVLLAASTMIVLIGPSRIYLGAHWIADVVAGYLVGGILLVLAILIYNQLSNKKANK